MKYSPKPIDTSAVKLSKETLELTATLANNTHDIWVKKQFIMYLHIWAD